MKHDHCGIQGILQTLLCTLQMNCVLEGVTQTKITAPTVSPLIDQKVLNVLNKAHENFEDQRIHEMVHFHWKKSLFMIQHKRHSHHINTRYRPHCTGVSCIGNMNWHKTQGCCVEVPKQETHIMERTSQKIMPRLAKTSGNPPTTGRKVGQSNDNGARQVPT